MVRFFYKYVAAGYVALCVCTSAVAAPTYYRGAQVRNMVYGGLEGGHNIQYQPEFQNSFYIGVNGAFNMASFKNTYSFASDPSVSESDNFLFETQMGFGVSAGYQFAPQWRTELDYGYSGKFEDQDSYADFTISSQYLMANILYTIVSWDTTNFYGGIGLGAVLIKSQMSGLVFMPDGNDTQSKTTFGGQMILGIEEFLTQNFAIGAEYRLMYNGGNDQSARRY